MGMVHMSRLLTAGGFPLGEKPNGDYNFDFFPPNLALGYVTFCCIGHVAEFLWPLVSGIITCGAGRSLLSNISSGTAM